jgi:hypothetical protein
VDCDGFFLNDTVVECHGHTLHPICASSGKIVHL